MANVASSSRTDQGVKPRLIAERQQIYIDARPRPREGGQLLRDALERFHRTFAVTAKRMETGDVVTGKRIVGTIRDPRIEAFQSSAKMPLCVVGAPLAQVDRADLDVQLEQRAFPQRMIPGSDERHLALVLAQRVVVLSSQVVHVPEARMGADDLQSQV